MTLIVPAGRGMGCAHTADDVRSCNGGYWYDAWTVDSQLVAGAHIVEFRARPPVSRMRVPERPNKDGSWREAWVAQHIVCGMTVRHHHFSQDALEYTQGRAIAAAAFELLRGYDAPRRRRACAAAAMATERRYGLNTPRQSHSWLCTRTEVQRPQGGT